MSFTQDDIEKIAHLARIAVDKDSTFSSIIAGQLENILSLVDKIQALDTEDIEPMAHPLDTKQRLRVDEVSEPNQRDKIQAIAPEGSVEAGLYLVPKVVE